MTEFSDILYGTVTLPDWAVPFIKLPEFLRLRGVRLSNVDSYQFKDFGAPCRWEHSIAVAYLAQRCARVKGLGQQDAVHLLLAGLLHDIATPPFAHTAEYVLDDFDHEADGENLLSGIRGKDFDPDFPIFAGQSSQFQQTARKVSKLINVEILGQEIGEMIVGDGDFGFLIHGTIDLDNADNVVRACLHMGMDVDRRLPLRLADWLAQQSHPPADIARVNHIDVAQWLQYRDELYRRFFECSDEELARQAFLQHLIRRAVQSGFPRTSIIWNTDHELLSEFERHVLTQEEKDLSPLSDLVKRYRLVEPLMKVVHIDIDEPDQLRILRLPRAVAWLESQLSNPGFEAMVLVSCRRYASEAKPNSLLKPPLGSLLVFKLGGTVKRGALRGWMKEQIPPDLGGRPLLNAIRGVINRKISLWSKEKPWLDMTDRRKKDVVARLTHIGDWSFRLSRNENIHPYPGTFVYSIPSNLITALELREELVLDPFGGTGQTAIEVLKQGGHAISADSNTIAHIAAKAKLTYLSTEQRDYLRKITVRQLQDYSGTTRPKIDGIEKWFHEKTLEELSSIWQFITHQREESLCNFLRVCFSAILPNCTGRRGKQHGYFADNTPLPAGTSAPPYQDAFGLFIKRVSLNMDVIERFYAAIERDSRDTETELAKARALKLDVTEARPEDYGVECGSVAAIITSPPYLCMADYTLGQRLSYYWIGPDTMREDFNKELGARRLRTSPQQAATAYWKGLRSFARISSLLLRPNGFLATVLGAPVAKDFRPVDIYQEFDTILKQEGFSLLWSQLRPVNWHRNHGYSRLKEERVAVHVLQH